MADTVSIVCPYCGERVVASSSRCPACRGVLDPLSRQATQNEMGPWFLRDPARPFHPGFSYDTLMRLLNRGKLGPEVIIRGPTTGQFWTEARKTPGVAHRLGMCHRCGSAVEPGDLKCPACGAGFSANTDRQHLGLAPVRDTEAMASARAAVESINREPGLAELGADRLRAEIANRVRRAEPADLAAAAAAGPGAGVRARSGSTAPNAAGPQTESGIAPGARAIGSGRRTAWFIAILVVTILILFAVLIVVVVYRFGPLAGTGGDVSTGMRTRAVACAPAGRVELSGAFAEVNPDT